MPDDQPKDLTDVVDDLKEKAAEDGDLSAREAVDLFAGRLFGPLLLIPGLVIMTPLGGIPTVPTIMGVLVILVAGQSLIGRKNPWLPGLIAERSVDEEKFRKSVEKARPWLEWIDKFTAQRLQLLIEGPMTKVIAAVCIVIACTLPPLELLPFAAIVPGIALFLLGLAVTAHDGVLALVGLIASAGALGTVGWWLLGGG